MGIQFYRGFGMLDERMSLFCTYDYDKMKRKIKILAKHLRGMDVFCIQESRGSWQHILKHCRLIMRDFWIKASFGEGFGGILTLISKKSCPSEDAGREGHAGSVAVALRDV